MEDSNRVMISTVSTAMFYCIIWMLILNIPDKRAIEIPKTIEIYVSNIDNKMEQEISQKLPKPVKNMEKLIRKSEVKQNAENKQSLYAVNNNEIVTNTNATKESAEVVKNNIRPLVKNSNEILATQKQHNESILATYLATVRQKIQEEIKYPITAKRIGLEGETVVRFSIASDGSVKDNLVEVVKSSGNNSFDKSAVNAVLDATLFDKPPSASMEIVVPVVFKLNNKG